MKVKNQTPTLETDDHSSLRLVLILSTENSCRRQMTAGLLRAAVGAFLEVASAGSEPAGLVHPPGVNVMAETGTDIFPHHSRSLNKFFPHLWKSSSSCLRNLTSIILSSPRL